MLFKKSLLRHPAWLALGIAAYFIAPSAFAKDASKLQPCAASSCDEIVVTGERALDEKTEVGGRLGLTIRETPATIDVLTQKELQIEGARSAIEAMNSAPGLTSGNLPGSISAASMRGFHRAINYLYDGVRQANSDAGMRNYDSWSFERIEVIKGPASVTSGEGALAGAINFVPRRPNFDRQGGEVLASYGSRNTARLAGDFNAPLNETAAVRGDLAYSRSDGWVTDTDSKTFAALLSVALRPTDKLSLTFSGDYFRDEFSTAYYGTPLVPAAIARDPSDAVTSTDGLVLDKSLRKTNYNFTDGDMHSDNIWLRAHAEYELTDQWRLVSDTTYYDSDRLWQDADEYSYFSGTLINRGTTLISHDHQYWSERVHAAFDGDIAGFRNRFTAGLEYSKTDFFTKRRFGETFVDAFDPVRGEFPSDDTDAIFPYGRQNVTAKVKSVAYFAEDAFNLTPELLLVGGVRLDDFKLDRSILSVSTGGVQAYSQDFDPVTWRAGAVYSVTPHTQLFAQYTKAATPVTGLFFLSASNARFDVTTGESYEAGVKTSLLDDTLELTASLYHISQDDILTRDPNDPTIVYQGGSQFSEGGEIAVTWTPTEEWRFQFSGSLLNAEFDEFREGSTGADRAGNRPINTPERLTDFVATYSPKALPLSFTGIVRHNGDFYTDAANSIKVNDFTTLDAAIAWKAPFGTLTVRGRNLTNEFYADWSGYASGLVFVGEPRSYEVSLTKSF